ncbi:unnamed protein product [Symbiodinium sp. CCMP2592]|nr:unnamed protein product [Symbiodinium sp. CCMP2592]
MSSSMSLSGYAVMSSAAWRKTLSYGLDGSTTCHAKLQEAIYQACRISSRALDATISDGKVPSKKRDRGADAQPVMKALVKTKFMVVCVEVKNVQSAHESGAFRSSSSESFHVQLRSEHVQASVYKASLSAATTQLPAQVPESTCWTYYSAADGAVRDFCTRVSRPGGKRKDLDKWGTAYMTDVTTAAVLGFAAAAGRQSSVSLLVHHVPGTAPPSNLMFFAVWLGKQPLAVTGTVAAEMVVVGGGPMISLEASLRQWRQEGRIAEAKATEAQVKLLKKELAEAENLLSQQKADLGDLPSESGTPAVIAASSFQAPSDEGQETDDSDSQESSRRRTA